MTRKAVLFKSALSIIAVLLISCSGPTGIERTVIVTGYDFSSYTANGFMFSPEQYLQPYEAIGLIDIQVIPEVKKWERPDSLRGFSFETFPEPKRKWQVEEIKTEFLLQEMYERATRMGADAVVRLEIKTETRLLGGAPTLEVPVFHISGFAIKRKGAEQTENRGQ